MWRVMKKENWSQTETNLGFLGLICSEVNFEQNYSHQAKKNLGRARSSFKRLIMSSGEIQRSVKTYWELVMVWTLSHGAHKARGTQTRKRAKSNAVCGVLRVERLPVPTLDSFRHRPWEGFIWEVGSEMGKGRGLCTLHDHHSGHQVPLHRACLGDCMVHAPGCLAWPPPPPSPIHHDETALGIRVSWLIQWVLSSVP